jgi:hypothetical protein
VDKPTICQSIRMGRSGSQDSKSKISKKAKVILIFKKIILQGGTLKNLLLHRKFFYGVENQTIDVKK